MDDAAPIPTFRFRTVFISDVHLGTRGCQAELAERSALDMQGHVELAKSGQDGDLKCILKGISQDLSLKLKDLMGAPTGVAEDLALRDMSYLLRDNIEVITTPPKAGSISG